MAFKGDCDDIRDSLSYKLKKLLLFQGADVMCSDEYVEDGSFVKADQLFAECSHVIVGAPHSAYKKLKVPTGVRILDPWGIVSREGARHGG